MARVAHVINGLRIAAAIVGGIGTLVSAAKGTLLAGGLLFVRVRMGDFTNRVYLLLIGSKSTTAIFGLMGRFGTGLILAGRRLGAWILLTGGAGMGASTLAYPLFLPVVMAPAAEAPGEPVDYPSVRHYVVGFAPAAVILLGAALAFLARIRSRNQPGLLRTDRYSAASC